MKCKNCCRGKGCRFTGREGHQPVTVDKNAAKEVQLQQSGVPANETGAWHHPGCVIHVVQEPDLLTMQHVDWGENVEVLSCCGIARVACSVPCSDPDALARYAPLPSTSAPIRPSHSGLPTPTSSLTSSLPASVAATIGMVHCRWKRSKAMLTSKNKAAKNKWNRTKGGLMRRYVNDPK